MTTMSITREAWLESAIEILRPRFVEIGMPLPEKLHVSVGFGYGARKENGTILGQCIAGLVSEDQAPHIFISPEINDTALVIGVLVHELLHAANNCRDGHRGQFAEGATRLGLIGPMPQATPGVALAAELMCMAESLGEYRHAAIHLDWAAAPTKVGPDGKPAPRTHSGPAKQSTRMLKLECPCCGYSVRTTTKWISKGLPFCPTGTQMIEA
ncbi:hypothetical protein D5S17_32730 [Pseudonocardiaceae bacterium YIM PH 21723]|nr:hypothetical protein D5S17_32730 [Pseudonocardiaceae bacterium YIM PH 21723]